MSLASVLNTARSGMSAAVTSVEAVSHNLANSRTNGYKAVHPVFAEQRATGGTLQIGTGVEVTGIAVDNSPGPLVATSDGVVELSNTDIGTEMVNLILAKDQFMSNATVFDTAAGMLDVLFNLQRSD
jgi:flagellar basal body rod protein FlgC